MPDLVPLHIPPMTPAAAWDALDELIENPLAVSAETAKNQASTNASGVTVNPNGNANAQAARSASSKNEPHTSTARR